MSSQAVNSTARAALGIEELTLDDDFFEKTLNSLYDGVYFVDTHRRILFWNRGAERLTGYASEEIVGCYCFENILQHTTASGCQLCHKGCPLIKTIKSGEPLSARVFLLHKDRRRIAVDVHVAPLRDDRNRIIGGVEIFRDASSAVALEKAYATMREMAQKDHLTGVANRRQMDRLTIS